MRSIVQELAPSVHHEGLERMLGGDLVASARPRGRRLVIAFRGAYELQLFADDAVVGRNLKRADRRALIYVARRVPALYAALEQTFSLVLDELSPGDHRAVDLYHRSEGVYLAHGEMLNRISRLDIEPLTFAPIAPPRHEVELSRALEGLSTLGECVELRREEDGVVVARARFDRSAQRGHVR